MDSLTYDLVLAGLAVGSAAALTGIGLIVTYRATGVLNLAHGAIAMICAFLLRQLAVGWGWPLPLAACLTLLVAAPGLGLLMSLLGGDPTRALVASIGVFVLLIGVAGLVWGPGARADAPALLPDNPWIQLAAVGVLAGAVTAVTRWTRFGQELRAVVDNRALAELGGIDAGRVAAAGWAFGSFTAGLTGVLLAPYVRLDPYGLPLLVMEVMAVAVAARMRSLPVAVATALALGVAQAQLTRLHPPGRLDPLLQAVGSNLFVVALLIAALTVRWGGAGEPTPLRAWHIVRARTRHGGPRTVRTPRLSPTGPREGPPVPAPAKHPGPPAAESGGPATRTSHARPTTDEPARRTAATGRTGQAPAPEATDRRTTPQPPEPDSIAKPERRAAMSGPEPMVDLTPPSRTESRARRPAAAQKAPHSPPTAAERPTTTAEPNPHATRTGQARSADTAQPTVVAGPGTPCSTTDGATQAPAPGAPEPSPSPSAATRLALAPGARRRLRALRARTAHTARAGRPPASPRIRDALWVPAGALLSFPLVFGPHAALPVPALAVVLLSLVVVTGRSGQLALGQAAYAGLGALFTARLGVRLPELAALAAAVVLVAPFGLLTGWPAIRRRGLALALTTLAVGTAVSRFVLDQPYATSGVTLSRPAGFTSDRAFYSLELAVLIGALLAVAALRRGRSGRALAAMRDHEQGAAASGVPVPRLKLLAFTLGAALAALGGGLLSMGAGAFDPTAYDPVRGLLWFAALMILGADILLAAPAAAALLTALDSGSRTGLAATAVGALALLLTRFRPALRPPRRSRTLTPLGERARARLSPPAQPAQPTPPAPTRSPAPRIRAVTPPGPLVAHQLRLSYGAFTVLDGVDITVEPGRITALIGSNGAGKSTLFHCLCGTLRPASGRVTLAGSDITRRSAHARTRLGVARTFQQLAVFSSLTIAEQVRIGAEQGRVRDPGRTVDSVLRLLDLDGPVRNRHTAGLPTGILRRVELARALAGQPYALLLDEPAAGLDADEARALAATLAALAAHGTAVLVVEHDLDLVAGIADRVHTMEAGRITP
ncbi:ATP-binding cassette domain-containing protein [Streptomyces sp. NPDC050738]|uniref:ABC transporter permease subunit n=1 Tax=Streptomyces sp. NPDC050738 TaxID=3154744 RepID=UPI0034368CF4